MTSRTRRKLIWGVLVACLLLLVSEIGFRIIYRMAADERDVEDLRMFAAGPRPAPAMQFVPHDDYFYAYDPAMPGVNRHGFWGDDLTTPRLTGQWRVVLIGDSTVASQHGFAKALQRQLTETLGRPGQVGQLAMPGWTLRECAMAATALLGQIKPDVVVVHAGANDMAAAAFPDFQPDYSHWRQPRYGETRTAYRRMVCRRRLLQTSHLLAFIVRAVAPHPSSGPNLDQLANRTDIEPLPMADYSDAFKRALAGHLEAIVKAGHDAGARVVLSTQPTCPGRLSDPNARAGMIAFAKVFARVIKNVEADMLIDMADAFPPDCKKLFLDFIHVGPQGDEIKARLTTEAIKIFLDQQSQQGEDNL